MWRVVESALEPGFIVAFTDLYVKQKHVRGDREQSFHGLGAEGIFSFTPATADSGVV